MLPPFAVAPRFQAMRHVSIVLLLFTILPSCERLAPPAGSAAQSMPRAGGSYLLRPGDNLFRIAEGAYGNGLEWYRIQEANPWIDPARLLPGQRIEIPPLADEGVAGPVSPIRRIGVEMQTEPLAGEPPAAGWGNSTTHSNPGRSSSLWRSLRQRIGEKTFFGLSLDRLSFYILFGSILHAFVQGFIVWITTTITFVKDASIRKSLHASFLTELLTLSTVAVFAVVGLMMVYAGTPTRGDTGEVELFPTLERTIGDPSGMMLAGGALLALYVLLSMRFIPQVFALERSRGFTVVFLGVVLPHLLGFYLLGHRLGMLQ